MVPKIYLVQAKISDRIRIVHRIRMNLLERLLISFPGKAMHHLDILHHIIQRMKKREEQCKGSSNNTMNIMLQQDHITHKQGIITNHQICFNNKANNNNDRMDEILITTETTPIYETKAPLDMEIKTLFREVFLVTLGVIIIINVELVDTKIIHRT